jgi:hypothetical protein
MKNRYFAPLLFVCSVAYGQLDQADQALEFLQQKGGPVASEEENMASLAQEFYGRRAQEIRDMSNQVFRLSNSTGRRQDPFGLAMGEPLKKQVTDSSSEDFDQAEAQRMAAEASAGFGTAVRGIDIRGVNPGRNEFLVGVDNVYEGDVVDISGAGGVFRLWIVEVADDGVTVMDDRSKKTEKIPLSLGYPSVPNTGWGAAGKVEEAPPY